MVSLKLPLSPSGADQADFGLAQLIVCFGIKHWLVFPGIEANVRQCLRIFITDPI